MALPVKPRHRERSETIDLRDEGAGHARGRDADAPQEIPPLGWLDVAKRVKQEAKDDNITLLAAGIAFFALLSSAPALAATVSLYGLVASPDEVASHVRDLSGTMPAEAQQLLSDQLTQVSTSSHTGLGIGVVLGLVLALWGASAAMKHLLVALSGIYDERETRGYVALRGRALLLTMGGLLFMGVCLLLLTVAPSWVESNLGGAAGSVVSALRWPLLAVLMIAGLAVLYRYAPDRDEPRWRWVSWGAAIATGLWLVASALFSLYVSHFGSYNKTYGSMAAVIIMMMWLFLTALCVLAGGEINAELEHQTAKDSTKGPARPLGDRDAYVADTVGEAAS